MCPVLRRDDPTKSQACRRERLRDAVDVHRVPLHLRPETHRIDVRDIAERQHPIHLVVHEVELGLVVRTPRVLLEDEVADGAECLGVERGAGGVEWRVEREHPRATQRTLEQFRCRKEVGFRAAGDRHTDRARHVAVMVVVPRRHGIHDAIAGIDQRAVRRIDAGT
jgi:hypothetical protein